MSFLVPRRNDLFAPVEQEFNKFFDEFFGGKKSLDAGATKFPRMDAYESDGHLVMQFSVAGTEKDDLEIDVSRSGDRHYLTVSGKMASEADLGEDTHYHVKELRRSSFRRGMYLPDNVESPDPDAVLRNGILTLKWKLRDDKERPQKTKVEIRSG